MKKPQFIIMSYPRTGSTLLCSSLDQHPDIKVGMELFHGCLAHCGNDQLLDWREDTFQKLYAQGENDLLHIDALNRYTLDESKCGGLGDFARLIVKQYNGFKFQYYQLHITSPVWDFYEKGAPDLKVIFLERDLLECTLSLRLAQNTGTWQKFNKHEVITDVPQDITLSELRRFYRTFCTQEDCYKNRWENSITVNYDELIGNWESVTERIQRFIGLDVVSLPQYIFKRTSGSLRELILNYDYVVAELGELSPYEYAKNKERLYLI